MSFSRRELLAASGAGALAAAAPAAFAAPATSAQLDALFDRVVQQNLDLAPEGATSLGLDIGARAHQRSELGDRSPAGALASQRLNERLLAELGAFDASALSPADQLNREIVLYGMRQQAQNFHRFKYAGGNAGTPYAINQFQGSAFHDLPDFLDAQHPIETADDAEAYLARLAKYPTAMDQEAEQTRLDASLGDIAPDFVLDGVISQLVGLRATPADKSTLIASLVRRTAAKKIPGAWGERATKIYETAVLPGFDRQLELVRQMRGRAGHDAGVWRLPDGEAYYRASVAQWTTTELGGEEIHRLGSDLVAKLSGDVDTAMKAQGLTQGTVGQRFRALYDDPKYRYANTDEGKATLLADLNAKVGVVQARLPEYFGAQPKAKLEIRRIPPYTESGAPGGYYQGGALDGSRPGAYYINLRDTAEVPSWTLPTLTYHEGIPGHHLQISIAQEARIPLIRKLVFYSAYGEGWALYAEQLADEMGMYQTDQMGRIGYLHDALFRAVRLVVDSGVHAKRWSREQAIAYYVDHLGDKNASAVSEVERYCVWPGQACGYMLGKLAWLKARSGAQAALGPRFDIHGFHDAGLTSGAMPLDILPKVIDGWVKTRQV
ncbi:MAG TPA: DUF885 family protein [Caulobacteraceae bacterium]|jgi:uncharacterized protein (DUF885 family)|nr:DUF885 family protein [Caulobacteraceae bacterium]